MPAQQWKQDGAHDGRREKLTDRVTLGEHAHSGNDVAAAVGGEGRKGVVLEHLPDDLELTLALGGRLAVHPTLTLLERQVGLDCQLAAYRMDWLVRRRLAGTCGARKTRVANFLEGADVAAAYRLDCRYSPSKHPPQCKSPGGKGR